MSYQQEQQAQQAQQERRACVVRIAELVDEREEAHGQYQGAAHCYKQMVAERKLINQLLRKLPKKEGAMTLQKGIGFLEGANVLVQDAMTRQLVDELPWYDTLLQVSTSSCSVPGGHCDAGVFCVHDIPEIMRNAAKEIREEIEAFVDDLRLANVLRAIDRETKAVERKIAALDHAAYLRELLPPYIAEPEDDTADAFVQSALNLDPDALAPPPLVRASRDPVAPASVGVKRDGAEDDGEDDGEGAEPVLKRLRVDSSLVSVPFSASVSASMLSPVASSPVALPSLPQFELLDRSLPMAYWASPSLSPMPMPVVPSTSASLPPLSLPPLSLSPEPHWSSLPPMPLLELPPLL